MHGGGKSKRWKKPHLNVDLSVFSFPNAMILFCLCSLCWLTRSVVDRSLFCVNIFNAQIFGWWYLFVCVSVLFVLLNWAFFRLRKIPSKHRPMNTQQLHTSRPACLLQYFYTIILRLFLRKYFLFCYTIFYDAIFCQQMAVFLFIQEIRYTFNKISLEVFFLSRFFQK